MNFKKLLKFMPNQRKILIEKMVDSLKIGGKSERTVANYVHAIVRFLNYFKHNDISMLNQNDILQYFKVNYLNKNCAANTYNMNLAAIKFFFSINFNKEFNTKLLPRTKLAKKLPATVDKHTFLHIFNNESNLMHKCWLLLAYSSGLRAHEIATIKLNDINSSEHKLKVLGKGNKERCTVLPDFTIKYLRLFYKHHYFINGFVKRKNVSGYLFEGNQNSPHISSTSIVNYFTSIKHKYNLDDSLSFHSLRHSFATNFIKDGGDPFVLKSLLGHSSLNTTAIYIHMGRDFNNIKGINYDEL